MSYNVRSRCKIFKNFTSANRTKWSNSFHKLWMKRLLWIEGILLYYLRVAFIFKTFPSSSKSEISENLCIPKFLSISDDFFIEPFLYMQKKEKKMEKRTKSYAKYIQRSSSRQIHFKTFSTLHIFIYRAQFQYFEENYVHT